MHRSAAVPGPVSFNPRGGTPPELAGTDASATEDIVATLADLDSTAVNGMLADVPHFDVFMIW